VTMCVGGRRRQVAEAYEVLSDPDRRAVYDRESGHGDGEVRFYQEEQSVVRPMTSRSFNNRDMKVLHVVDFYAPWCGHCQELAPHYRKAALAFDNERSSMPTVHFHAVNCDEQGPMCRELGVQSYPSVR
jgi:thiol-disulfide isomerase/thioredoxin